MRLLASGEGPTDLGTLRPTPNGEQFVAGPMTVLVDRLLEQPLGYSLLDSHAAGDDCIRYVSETQLAAHGRPGPMLLPGIKHGKGMAFYTRNAQVLGILAKEEAAQHQRPTIAVLFRDGDGTRSVASSEWQQKFDSIKFGFELAACDTGVPMVPRPKSEAWLLCGLKQQPYHQCDALEDAPGNDESPRALKRRLAEAIGGQASGEEQAQWLRDGQVDPARIDMPSFNAFRAELQRAAAAALAG